MFTARASEVHDMMDGNDGFDDRIDGVIHEREENLSAGPVGDDFDDLSDEESEEEEDDMDNIDDDADEEELYEEDEEDFGY